MELKYSQLSESIGALEELSAKELPYRVALRVSQNTKKIREQLQDYYAELEKISKECLEFDEDGNPVIVQTEDGGQGYQIKKDKIEEYNDNVKELNDFTVEIPISTINLNDLCDIKMSPTTAGGIEFMVEDDET